MGAWADTFSPCTSLALQVAVLVICGAMLGLPATTCTRLYPAIARARSAPSTAVWRCACRGLIPGDSPPPLLLVCCPTITHWAHPPPPHARPAPAHLMPLSCCSGYSFSHNVSNGILGGLIPLAITATNASLASRGQSTTFGASWWILAASSGTFIAVAGIHWHAPYCNFTPGSLARHAAAASERERQAGVVQAV